jgi:hypothetical protein
MKYAAGNVFTHGRTMAHTLVDNEMRSDQLYGMQNYIFSRKNIGVLSLFFIQVGIFIDFFDFRKDGLR